MKHPDFVPPKAVGLSKDYDDPTSILGRKFANVVHAPALAILATTFGGMVRRPVATDAPDALALDYDARLPALAGVLDAWRAINAQESAPAERRSRRSGDCRGCRSRAGVPADRCGAACDDSPGRRRWLIAVLTAVRRPRRRSGSRPAAPPRPPSSSTSSSFFRRTCRSITTSRPTRMRRICPAKLRSRPMPGTPAVAGLIGRSADEESELHQPRERRRCGQSLPLAPSQAATADQDHSYTQEQLAYDHGKMDFFPGSLGQGDTPPGGRAPPVAEVAEPRVLRRQHGDRALELRAAVRDERSVLPDDVRAVGARGVESRLRPDERRDARSRTARAPTCSSTAAPDRTR